ncbi:MAG: hypothetical protein PHX62_00850 [Bacilli bacterium]|nr:hypothetical protein [Bacilli bacterium]
MNIKELKSTRLFINILIALAGFVLFLSLFSTLYSVEGVVYYDTDDVGNEIGMDYKEVMKTYNFVLPIPTKDTNVNYYSWEISLLYIILFIAIIFNFLDMRKHNQIKQYVISGIFIVLSLLLIFAITNYKKELEFIFDEFANSYFSTSYINVTNGSAPFLAYLLTIIAGILSIYKASIIMKISEIENKNKRIKR